MQGGISAEERILLEILSEELRDKPSLNRQESVDWQQIFIRAERHQVLALLFDKIATADLSETEKEKWLSKIQSVVLQNYHLLFTAKYVVDILEEKGIPCVLLKGATVANCFAVPELRKSGDVDILLLNKEHKKRVEKILLDVQFKKSSEQHASHHTVWYSPEQIEVEIHDRLTELFNNKTANKKLDEIFQELPNQVQREKIMGIEFPILQEGFQAYHLLLHMLVHYMHSGFGLRLLCDWVAFWNRDILEDEKHKYQNLVKKSGLQKFSDVITSVCIYFLGLKNPELGECIAKEEAENFLKDVLDAEEFGISDSDRMLVLNGTGIREYIKEFHHQTKMNFPRGGKICFFWPVLWLCTLVRFVVNNHKLRRTTSWKILKKTHERSRKINELQLFQIHKE